VPLEVEESHLVSRCLKGEPDAWQELVRRYHRKVWNVAYHFVGRAEEADELTQEIFIRVYQNLGSFEPSGNLSGWLLRVARNYCIDHYRRRRVEKTLTSSDEPDPAVGGPASEAPSPHDVLEQKDLAHWIRTALDRIAPELRQAVVLRDLQEMSYEEMAALLEVPLGTVKSRINRGRIELSRLLTLRRGEWSSALGARESS